MFIVLKQLENGEFVHVASRDDLQNALQLAQALKEHWPGDYEVRDSHSQLVEPAASAHRESTSECRPQQLRGRLASADNLFQ